MTLSKFSSSHYGTSEGQTERVMGEAARLLQMVKMSPDNIYWFHMKYVNNVQCVEVLIDRCAVPVVSQSIHYGTYFFISQVMLICL